MGKNLKIRFSWLVFIILSFAIIYLLTSSGMIDEFYEITLVTIGINIILAMGLNLIIGFAGQFSLGHAGFMAIGAYCTAIMTLKMPNYFGFILGVLIGGVLASVVALVVGIPTLRLKGDYLAIATLGVSEIIRIVILNMDKYTNGAAGLNGIPNFTTWQLIFIFIVLTSILLLNFVHSSGGRSMIAIREDEIAAESMGIHATKYKVIAFVLGAFTASIAGSLYASYFGSVEPKVFGFMKSVDILIIVVFGGIGSMTGTVLAAIILGVLNMFLQDYGDLRMIIYALALILIMVFKPSGLLGTREFSLAKLLQRFTKKGGKSDDVIGS